MLGFFAFILHLVWVGCAFFGFMTWRRLKDVEGARPMAIAQAKPGSEASFQGVTAFAGEERTSMIGAVPAVWFDWAIERRAVELPFGQRDQNEHRRETWDTVASGSSNEPFALLDGAGNRLIVWPMDAQVRDTRNRDWAGDFPDTASGTLRDQMIEGIGILSSLTGVADLRFSESWLEPGVACFVVGRVEAPEPGHGPEVRGLIRGGTPFIIAAGTPGTALDSLRQTVNLCALGGVVAFLLAVAAMALS